MLLINRINAAGNWRVFGLAAIVLLTIAPSSGGRKYSKAYIACPVDIMGPSSGSAGAQIQLSANPANYTGYDWDVSSGEIVGPKNTPAVSVILGGAGSTCVATLKVRDKKCINSKTHQIAVTSVACPRLNLTCPESVEEGNELIFSIEDVPSASYNWTVSDGEILEGQGTRTIKIKTDGLAGKSISATVMLGGVSPDCNSQASCTVEVKARPKS